jgi:hypothetical protein
MPKSAMSALSLARSLTHAASLAGVGKKRGRGWWLRSEEK